MTNCVSTISVEKTKTPKEKSCHLGFGKCFTDHMFMMDYNEDQRWHHPRIIPYQPILLDPAAVVLHYSQTVFEGLKAHRTENNQILLFRPKKHLQRLNHSNDRLAIPPLDEEFCLEAAKMLIQLDESWVPHEPGQALYVRPFIIATEPNISVSCSHQFTFLIILSPVGAYYKEGFSPISIFVEPKYVRAVKGGVGHVKTGGNYAASFKAQEKALAQGCSQVLWLDGVYRKYIDEVGLMNVFFKIGEKVITPNLNGSILAGITRDSVIQLLRYWNVSVEERQISIDELVAAQQNGTLLEAFGTGTAAVICPLGEFYWQEQKYPLNNNQLGPLTLQIYETLTEIQCGRKEDIFNWMEKV